MLSTLNRLNLSPYKFNVDISEKMSEICQPLFTHFKINNFGYVKLFNDGTMLRVSTQKEWTKKYFEQQYYNDAIFYDFDSVTAESPIIKIMTDAPSRELSPTLSDHYLDLYDQNIWNIFTQYQRTQDFAEVWFFAAERDCPEMANFYFNHQKILQHFMEYFKESAAPILVPNPDILIATKLHLSSQPRQEEQKIKKFMEEIGKPTAPLKVSLSTREKDCIRYVVMGKTAKEIARILQISYRTVEFHLNNIKQKTGCKRLVDLLKLIFSKDFL